MYNPIMKDKFIRSVAEFMEWVGEVCEDGKREMLYRGLADSTWEVSASIYGRLQKSGIKDVDYESFREMTKWFLARARLEGHDIENHRNLPDLELLAKLQHGTAATCLIDFTSSPLVALWFACQTPKGKQGRVIAFDSGDTDLCREVQAKNLSESIDTWLPANAPDKRLWVLPPKKTNNRIVAQQSVFVFGQMVIAQEQLADKENCLVEDKNAVLNDLAKQGITAESLFCDFAGFAMQNSRNEKYHSWTTENDFISGRLSLRAGDNKGAIKFNSNVIKAKPESAPAYNNRGLANSKLGHYGDAIADYDRAIELDPQSAAAYYNRGLAKDELRREYKSAIADYDRAIELDPQHADAYNNRGVAKEGWRDKDGTAAYNYADAIADFDEALKINPQHAIALGNRERVKKKLEDSSNS